jgi:hypothetical protein
VLEKYNYMVTEDPEDLPASIGKLTREVDGLAVAMMYGPGLDDHLLHQIRQTSAVPVETLNPFRHVAVAPETVPGEHLTVPSYRFAAAIGAALRRD